MKKCKGLAALFVTSVFALSAFCVTAGAVDGEGEYAGDSSVAVEDPVTDYNSDSSAAYDPGYDDSSSYSDYSSDDSSYDDYNYSSSYSYDSDYYGGYSSSSSSDYYYSDNNGYNDYNYSSSSSYYSNDYSGGYGDYSSSSGDGYYEDSQNSDDSYYESATDSLIKSENDIDDSTLSNGDWSDIAKALGSTGSDSAGDDDFSFIKNNTSTGDNGHWMLYVSIALLVASFIGIAYFVGSTVLSRKRAAAGGKGAAAVPKKGGKTRHTTDDYGAHARRMRSDDDYGDGYTRGGAQKHRKYDTAEINLSDKNPSNGSGGRRYR